MFKSYAVYAGREVSSALYIAHVIHDNYYHV